MENFSTTTMIVLSHIPFKLKTAKKVSAHQRMQKKRLQRSQWKFTETTIIVITYQLAIAARTRGCKKTHTLTKIVYKKFTYALASGENPRIKVLPSFLMRQRVLNYFSSKERIFRLVYFNPRQIDVKGVEFEVKQVLQQKTKYLACLGQKRVENLFQKIFSLYKSPGFAKNVFSNC